MVKKILTQTTVLALITGALIPFIATAQSPQVKMTREALTGSTAKVSAPEKTEDKVKIFSDALTLTLAEIDDALSEKKLGALIDRSDIELVSAANALKKQLTAYRVYVALIQDEVRRGITAEELKEVAAQFKDWREAFYVPVVRQAFNLLLVAQGADVLLVAQRRFERVAADVAKVQLTAGSALAGQFIALLDAAKADILSAQSLYERAYGIAQEDQMLIVRSEQEVLGIGIRSQKRVARGPDGDFICSPLVSGKINHCAIAFKSSEGDILAVVDEQGDEIVAAPGDVAQISGMEIRVPKTLARRIDGFLIAQGLNSVRADEQSSGPSAAAVRALRGKDESVTRVIEQELAAIRRAYQSFFSMSALATKLKGK